MTFKIFISYRRADTAGYAGWLNYCLAPEFGQLNVFRDLNRLQAGDGFREEIIRTLRQCDVVLCLIGPAWATITDAHGQERLKQPNDLVRREVAASLAPPKQMVIPVLVQEAKMPEASDLPEDLQGITGLNAQVMSDADWDRSLAQLLGRLQALSAENETGGTLEGQEIVRRHRKADRPPVWVGRNGGLRGKTFRDDVATGRWTSHPYEVRFGGSSPSRNYFPVEEFVDAVTPPAASPSK